MSGRVDVEKKKGWSNRPSARTVWRCPTCGDQTLQGRKGGTCGPCFLGGTIVALVPASRELASPPPGVADPRFAADEVYVSIRTSKGKGGVV